jgi:hypothetical protein
MKQSLRDVSMTGEIQRRGSRPSYLRRRPPSKCPKRRGNDVTEEDW